MLGLHKSSKMRGGSCLFSCGNISIDLSDQPAAWREDLHPTLHENSPAICGGMDQFAPPASRGHQLLLDLFRRAKQPHLQQFMPIVAAGGVGREPIEPLCGVAPILNAVPHLRDEHRMQRRGCPLLDASVVTTHLDLLPLKRTK